MLNDEIDSEYPAQAGVSSKSELLVSALLHLMSQYSVNAAQAGSCTKLASVIERHLKALADLPEMPPVLQATCRQLVDQWAVVVEQAVARTERPTLFARLVSGARFT